MIRRFTLTAFAILLMAAPASAQSSRAGNRYTTRAIIVVPQGVVKSGPRSYSQFDPANPYRETLDYAGRTGLERAERSVMPVANRNGNDRVEPRRTNVYAPFGPYGGPVIITNPHLDK